MCHTQILDLPMKLLAAAPTVHATASLIESEIGKWTEIHAHASMRQTSFDDYSHVVHRGDGVTFLAWVAICTGAVIGAGAVVSKDVAPKEVVAVCLRVILNGALTRIRRTLCRPLCDGIGIMPACKRRCTRSGCCPSTPSSGSIDGPSRPFPELLKLPF